LNLWSSIRNPFNRPSSNTKRFFITLNLVSFGSALAVLLSHKYGVSMFRVCYIIQMVQGTVSTSNTNAVLWVLFYLPIVAVFVFSVVVAVNSSSRLKRGLRETFAARERAIKRAQNFIICYSTYWAVTAVMYVAAQAGKNHSYIPGELVVDGHDVVTQLDNSNVPGIIFTILFTSKSIITLVVRARVATTGAAL
jgi:hypothetical protein